ncbi:MAG: hypothetical protein Q8M76_11850, partial [Spirochaetaceae bacterium]|nr:hypothetical protein [Spirochaetaceae bacterium]
DLVTLAFALPLLAAGWILSRRGSSGSRLLLAGALGYFLYCYGMMAVGTAYNVLFLLYVALFAASLWGFVLALSSIDAEELAARCSSTFPRRAAIALCAAMSAFLGLNWVMGIVLPALRSGAEPAGLDCYHTLFVQAIDVAVLVPAGIVCAVWLARRSARGYLLGAVIAVKGAAEGLAVAAMGFNMIRTGVAEAASSLPMVLGFLALALSALVVGTLALKSVGFKERT